MSSNTKVLCSKSDAEINISFNSITDTTNSTKFEVVGRIRKQSNKSTI